MIIEKMIELLILSEVIPNVGNFDRNSDALDYLGKKYDDYKLEDRFIELIEEFLEPYIIDSTSKE